MDSIGITRGVSIAINDFIVNCADIKPSLKPWPVTF